MMYKTHIALSVAATSITLGTADPAVLILSAIASQLPDVDTTKSYSGRVLFPLSSYLEKRFAHRSITHSFLALAIFAVVVFPVTFFGYRYYLGLVSGYFWGFFGDVFTKSGVALFYPSKVRAICPANPRLRLSTGSNAEWFVLFILVVFAILSIQINSAGGIVRSFNQALGLPSGAIETVNQDASRYLLKAHIKGRNAITQEPVEKAYEIIQPLNQNDLLVKDEL
ncbi:MAG: metal-dependent hydrolase, partial [Cyanobacteria bacterium J06631_2]